jgi:Ca2+-binding RTX toxin-like protein
MTGRWKIAVSAIAIAALAVPATAHAAATFRVRVTAQSTPDYVVEAQYDVLTLECVGVGTAGTVTINGQIVRLVTGAQVADPVDPNTTLTGPPMPCADLYGLLATGTAGNDVLEILTNAQEPAVLQTLTVIVDAGAGDDTVDLGARTAQPCTPETERCTTSRRVVAAGEGDDTLIGTTGADTLAGNAGNDVIEGGAGDDVLAGTDGDDSIAGGDGNDRLYGGFSDGEPEAGNDVVDGGPGNDRMAAGDGRNTLEGGPGNDALLADLAASEARSTWDGGAGDDVFVVGNGPTLIVGGSGNDRIDVRPDVTVTAALEVNAGAGNDDVDLSRAKAGLVVRLGRGRDIGVGGSGDDFIDGEAGNDRIGGGGGDDVLVGRAGNDGLGGGDGSDALYGGAGRDVLDGGPGGDLLAPGSGVNRLIGAQGDRCAPGSPNPPAGAGSFPAATGFGACPTATLTRRSAPSGT